MTNWYQNDNLLKLAFPYASLRCQVCHKKFVVDLGEKITDNMTRKIDENDPWAKVDETGQEGESIVSCPNCKRHYVVNYHYSPENFTTNITGMEKVNNSVFEGYKSVGIPEVKSASFSPENAEVKSASFPQPSLEGLASQTISSWYSPEAISEPKSSFIDQIVVTVASSRNLSILIGKRRYDYIDMPISGEEYDRQISQLKKMKNKHLAGKKISNIIRSLEPYRVKDNVKVASGNTELKKVKIGRTKEYGEMKETFDIYWVDGYFIRDNWDDDFILAGHTLVYNFIPSGEIWVEKIVKDEHEIISLAAHEIYEHLLMKYDGLEYDEAHKNALLFEKEIRQDVPEGT
jgi:phage FluMu protein Com